MKFSLFLSVPLFSFSSFPSFSSFSFYSSFSVSFSFPLLFLFLFSVTLFTGTAYEDAFDIYVT